MDGYVTKVTAIPHMYAYPVKDLLIGFEPWCSINEKNGRKNELLSQYGDSKDLNPVVDTSGGEKVVKQTIGYIQL